jgi:hypothetical protein
VGDAQAVTDARDELFTATLDAFVETRTRLAAALIAAGRKAEGQALKKVRRPSPVAWATNQVVRAARAEVEAFLAASDRLRGSQAAIVAGRGDRGLYEADAHGLREATAALAAAARRVLAERGRPDERALVDGVVANARAAALADVARAALLEGALGAELEGGTDAFGGLLASGALAAPALAKPPAAPRAPPAPSPRDQEARRREQERARDLEAARREETEARAAAASADESVTRARGVLDEARRRVDETLQAAREAERASRDAEAAHRDAQRAATESTTRAGRATRRREGLET